MKKISIEFTRYMLDTVEDLSRLGYKATRFRQMLLQNNDGPAVAVQLVMGDVSDGFWHLKQLNRLDLSVEMSVLLPQFEELFSEEVRERANYKLTEMGFNPEAYLQSQET